MVKKDNIDNTLEDKNINDSIYKCSFCNENLFINFDFAIGTFLCPKCNKDTTIIK